MKNDETLKEATKCGGIALSTAFRWRHRFLAAAQEQTSNLNDIEVADENFFIESRKGQRTLDQKPRHQGGVAKKRRLTGEQVLAFMDADTRGQTFNKVPKVVKRRILFDVLGPAINKNALPVAGVNRCYPLCT